MAKFRVEIEVKKREGPRVDADELFDVLVDEIESIDLWTDDTNFSVEVTRRLPDA